MSVKKEDRFKDRENTTIKHELLGVYLKIWATKVLSNPYHNPSYYVDLCAGQGTTKSGKPGSPLIALDIAAQMEQQNKLLKCIFIEKNRNTFSKLEKCIENNCNFQNRPLLIQESFQIALPKVLRTIKNKPAFFFVDPFNWDVPFEDVTKILSLPKTELFITFMSRDINRNLNNPLAGNSLTKLFGSTQWKRYVEYPNKMTVLREMYHNLLKDNGAKYVWDFKVNMGDKRIPIYYLIYATQNFHGLYAMKDVMYRKSADNTFSYLGPDDYIIRNQLKMPSFETEEIATWLENRYSGQRLVFWDLLVDAYPETWAVETHFKKSLTKLHKEGKVTLEKIGPKGGIKKTFYSRLH